MNILCEKEWGSPGPRGSVGWGVKSVHPKVLDWISGSGHTPRFRVQSPVQAHTGGNRSMYVSCINVFLCVSFSPFFFLWNELLKKIFLKDNRVNLMGVPSFHLPFLGIRPMMMTATIRGLWCLFSLLVTCILSRPGKHCFS